MLLARIYEKLMLHKVFKFLLFLKIMDEKEVSEKRIKRYMDITKKALIKAKKSINKKRKKEAEVLYDMAERYYNDAIYFKNKDMLVTAFAAINYAHGWLDSGSKLGLFKVNDDKLFVVK